MSRDTRLIAQYGNSEGPLLIAIGAVHGNEPAGVEAIRRVLHMLTHEHLQNPGFSFKGRFVGLIGNMEAYRQGKRYIDSDMNRMWGDVSQKDRNAPNHELEEIQELRQQLSEIMRLSSEQKVLILDLHTTSAESGIFCVTLDEPETIELARTMLAPVVTGLLNGVQGTLLHFCQSLRNTTKHKVLGIGFESGQHQDPLSIDRAVAAIILALRALGCVRSYDVNYHHVRILDEYSRKLPKEVSILHVHHIRPEDDFVMRPGYVNFQKIRVGEHLADDRNGPILSKWSARILMPLYQKQGSDGFFIVQDV